ncbi:transcriptional repressor [Clostridiaceae bacterium]|nr:transcriptional repressor [Clostridium sp.]NBI72705.1 transcriptional repressor [Clostridiaceae bacterium]
MKMLKYSRQREFIKSSLMGRQDHPTADALYTSIRKQCPTISLGTVYRNLNLLVELGEIQKISCGGGTDHFDYNTSPHYHFVCRTCGQIADIPMETICNLEAMAGQYVPGRIDGHTICFYGVCAECEEKSEGNDRGASSAFCAPLSPGSKTPL